MWVLNLNRDTYVKVRLRQTSEINRQTGSVETNNALFTSGINLSLFRVQANSFPVVANSLQLPSFSSPNLSTCEGGYHNNQNLIVSEIV